jgi:predicted MPP superfamily phosphohydrolase
VSALRGPAGAPVPRRRLRSHFTIGLPPGEIIRRLLWRPPHSNAWDYLSHDLPYHFLQIAWAFGRRLTGQRRVERLRVDRVRVPIPGLAEDFNGFRIVQLTDLHAGPPYPMYYLEHAVRLALQLPADLYVLTGDFITVWLEDAGPAATALRPLADHRPTWACLGNHDVWADPDRVHATLERAGISVLRNSGVPLARNGARVWLAGVDDAKHGKPDLEVALSGRPPDAPVVLLAHEPDFADEVAPTGWVALQLSGHTHGGQVVLPRVGPLMLPDLGRLYPPGLVRVGAMWVYTSRGVWSSWPVRFNSPAEISELELVCEGIEAPHRYPYKKKRRR